MWCWIWKSTSRHVHIKVGWIYIYLCLCSTDKDVVFEDLCQHHLGFHECKAHSDAIPRPPAKWHVCQGISTFLFFWTKSNKQKKKLHSAPKARTICGENTTNTHNTCKEKRFLWKCTIGVLKRTHKRKWKTTFDSIPSIITCTCVLKEHLISLYILRKRSTFQNRVGGGVSMIFEFPSTNHRFSLHFNSMHICNECTQCRLHATPYIRAWLTCMCIPLPLKVPWCNNCNVYCMKRERLDHPTLVHCATCTRTHH